jgi:hypothetical protein
MKYVTFRKIAIGVPLAFVSIVVIFLIASAVPETPATVQATPATQAPDPLQTPAPAPTTSQIRTALDQWLAMNPRAGATMKLVDILPQEPYKATALRFPEADAVKWSNDPNQWSQVRLDLNRDGKDEEKWLLKNGRTYKREILGASGKTIATEYFK